MRQLRPLGMTVVRYQQEEPDSRQQNIVMPKQATDRWQILRDCDAEDYAMLLSKQRDYESRNGSTLAAKAGERVSERIHLKRAERVGGAAESQNLNNKDIQ